MRRAIGTVAGVALAVVVAGCGGGESAPYSGPVANRAEVDLSARSTEAMDAGAGEAPASYYVVGDKVSRFAEGPPMLVPPDRPVTPTTVASVDHKPLPIVEPDGIQHAERWSPQRQMQAGTLTAGSIDDHADYAAFRDYLSDMLQRHPGQEFPSLNIGRRVVIRVTDGQGGGIGDARVTVRPLADGDAGAAAWSATTAGDGRALFLSAHDLAGSGSDFLLSVQPAGAVEPVTRQVSLEAGEWNIVLENAQQHLPTRLDLALVIDTTGSMQDELEYLKVEIDAIASAVKRQFPNVEQRFALILYRDEGDEYVTRTFDFTGSLPEFRSTLSQQRAGGGGDYPEAMHLALEQAGHLSWTTSDTARVLFLVGDAPPHPRFSARTMDAVESLRGRRVTLFPVAASGVRDEAEWIMRSAAFLTQGKYLFLTDHSGIGNAHATPHAPSYEVERLNSLMVRMIASELAGRPLLPLEKGLPSEIIATEANASYSAPQPEQANPPAPVYHEYPSVTYVERREESLAEMVGPWCQFLIESTWFRMILAVCAIGLIWRLDLGRRRAAS